MLRIGCLYQNHQKNDMEWIPTKYQLPNLGDWIAVYRIHYPSFYWIGRYITPMEYEEQEDHFDYWILIPEPPELLENMDE